jgi:hypothetical protein
MSLANHLEELERKHGAIEKELDEAMLHPSVDDMAIVTLKRRKLAIKDEIEKLRGAPTHTLTSCGSKRIASGRQLPKPSPYA